MVQPNHAESLDAESEPLTVYRKKAKLTFDGKACWPAATIQETRVSIITVAVQTNQLKFAVAGIHSKIFSRTWVNLLKIECWIDLTLKVITLHQIAGGPPSNKVHRTGLTRYGLENPVWTKSAYYTRFPHVAFMPDSRWDGASKRS